MLIEFRLLFGARVAAGRRQGVERFGMGLRAHCPLASGLWVADCLAGTVRL